MAVKRNNGFSLIELMVVLTIVGILGSASYAAYTGYTKYADRSQAQADLYEIAQILERGFTEARDYSAVFVSVGPFNRGKYLFQVNPQTATTYTVLATIDQSADDFDLSLDNNGIESFKLHGTGSWSEGWGDIPD